ncbi:MAG: 50S ribosomal protein L11 [Candidatus Margulisiibacteriota bacterium]|jgi:large subunit ribosomal protein L11
MAKQKQLKTIVKLQIAGGKATPAPPIGPALGQHGVSIMDFCKAYNDRTKDKVGTIVPVEIKIYDDRSFDFVLKTPPASQLILKAIGKEKGSAKPNRDKIGRIRRSQLEEIAKIKMPDLNANDLDQAVRIVMGSCQSMGVEVES